MADLVPSALLHSQAIKLLEVLLQDEDNASRTPGEFVADLAEVLSAFEKNAGQPLFEYFTFDDTEPPTSKKINRLWSAIAADLDVIQHQVDLNRSAVLSTFNFISSELESLRVDNARIKNKIKTLQLYSAGSDSKTVFFGDAFETLGFLDTSLVSPSEVPFLAGPGAVTLPTVGAQVNVSKDATVSILESSNGFLGRNQEALDTTDGVVFTGDQVVTSDLEGLLDARPDTWIEYERNSVTRGALTQTLGLNNVYKDSDGNRLNWNEEFEGPLALTLEIDLGQIENINTVSILPYGLEGNRNHPITIKKIQTSTNKTDWVPISPLDVVIGNSLNLATARFSDNVIVRQAFWQFESRTAQYLRIYIEQTSPIPSGVGHPYWVNVDTGLREEGPIPSVDDVSRTREIVREGKLEQKFEILQGNRWTIGLRDIEVTQTQYGDLATFVTRPLRAGGVIDRLLLEDVDVDIPESFDPEVSWVSFYVSPDNGENWYQISDIDDSIRGVPEQISFNDPLTESLREANVQNYNTEEPVTEIRFKAVLSRPPEFDFATPVLKSYRLKVRRR